MLAKYELYFVNLIVANVDILGKALPKGLQIQLTFQHISSFHMTSKLSQNIYEYIL